MMSTEDIPGSKSGQTDAGVQYTELRCATADCGND